VLVDIELGDAVASVRQELLDAAARETAAGLEFVVGTIELEFSVDLRRDAKVKSGFKAWVVSADVDGGITLGRAHRVKVTLTPRIGGEDMLIAGSMSRPEGPGRVPEIVGR
jgi:hypothetical protein